MEERVFVVLAPLDLHDSVEQTYELQHTTVLDECVNPFDSLISQQQSELV